MKKFVSSFLTLFLIAGLVFGFSINGNAMTCVKVTKTAQVVDSYNGVNAIYRPGGSDGSSATYSCAALVKKYYGKVYGVTPYNLLPGCTPIVSGDSFVEVSSPKVGDIVRCTNSAGVSSHWAIVQKVTSSQVVLLEQNWKWQQSGATYAKADRELNKNSSTLHYFRLRSRLNASKTETSSTQTTATTEKAATTTTASVTTTTAKRTLKLNYSDITLRYGKKQTCYIKGTIKNKKKGDKLVFSSSNTKIASVSSSGKITPKKKTGKCTVTVRIKGTSVKKTCIVRVRK